MKTFATPNVKRLAESVTSKVLGDKRSVTAAKNHLLSVFFEKNDRCPQDSRPVNPDLAEGMISLFFLF